MVNEQAVIEINKLSKRYAGRKELALEDLTLNVAAGEVYGFLGPNGAGKSTAIRTLLNFIQPSAGSAKIMGLDIVKDSVELKRHIGYLAGDVSLYKKMTGKELLAYMRELTPVKDKKYLKKLVNTYQAELNQPIHELSKGNRQKIGLIQAFMHEPEVLILDEPTSGLDPLMQAIFFDYVKAAKAAGASIFLSSHDLPEVQKMCDRVGFIRGGELIAEKSITDLLETAAHTFDVAFAGPLPLGDLKSLKSLKVEPTGTSTAVVHVRGKLAPFFGLLSRHKVISLDRREVNLEQEFMNLYKGGSK